MEHIKEFCLAFDLVASRQKSFGQQRDAGAEWKLCTGRLADVFGYGAEISRLCIVKLIQMNQRSGAGESGMVEVTQNHFEAYLMVVNKALKARVKANQFSEAQLIGQRADEMLKSVPHRFLEPKNNFQFLKAASKHFSIRIKL